MKNLFSISLFFVLLSCGRSEEKVVEEPTGDLLNHGEFISVIVDLQILQAHFHRLYIRPDLYATSLDSSSQLIFDEHDVTKEEFERTLSYYSSMTDSTYLIYEIALDSINQRIAGVPIRKE